jgi:hypothetical protein
MDIEVPELVLKEKGFYRIAEVSYKFRLNLWWNPEDKIELSMIKIGPYFIAKGIKSYVMRSITQDGELYIRDLNALHEYLEAHFTEIHISFSHFRDINDQNLIIRRIKDKKLRDTGESIEIDLNEKEARLEEIKREFVHQRNKLSETESLSKLTGHRSSLANSYLKNKFSRLKKELSELQNHGRELEKELFVNYKLLKEYRKKGAGAAFIFSYSSNLQVCNHANFQDAVNSIIKELKDMNHFQIKQKLFGGKLNIFVEEIHHPTLAYQMEWAGGALNPNQLDKLGPEFEPLRRCLEEYLMVIPTRDIVINGTTKDEKKLFSAKVIQNFLLKLERVESISMPKDLPKKGGWIGNVMKGSDITEIPFFHPVKLNHGYISGTTRSGKSYLARVTVENTIIEGAYVIILDPTMQWSGLIKPAVEENVLKRFDQLGISREHARGFNAKIYIPGIPLGLEVPENLRSLLKDCSVICLKYCDDEERCQIALNILKTIYTSLEKETDNMTYLVVMEEAHNFLPGNVMGKAKDVAKEVRILINRIAREKAKYGCNFLLISQSLSDFKGEAKIVREMINSRFFLRASDKAELEYIEDYVSKEAKEIVKNLKQGEALIHGYAVSAPSGIKVFVRPPFSHVGELSDAELKSLIGNCAAQPIAQQQSDVDTNNEDPHWNFNNNLTEREQRALKTVKDYYGKYKKPITAIELGNKIGLQGGSRQRIIEALVRKRFIKTITISDGEKGRPSQGIIPVI